VNWDEVGRGGREERREEAEEEVRVVVVQIERVCGRDTLGDIRSMI